MRILPKLQNGKKVRVASEAEQKRNIAKKQELNANGYNVTIDGSWGPWLDAQYRRMKLSNLPAPESFSVPTDAIEQTLYVSGVPQRKRAQQVQQQVKEQQEAAQNRRREEYRTRKRAELQQRQQNPLDFGARIPVDLSDAAVDAALEQEAREAALRANQPIITQGYSPSERDARRRAGLLVTEEDADLAENMAHMNNNFLLRATPYIDPQQARRLGPVVMQEYTRANASVLPNAFVAGLTFRAPSASGAVVQGIRQGWQTAGNIASRTGQAIAQGAKAAVPVVTNPRWAATTATVTAPSVADAAETVAETVKDPSKFSIEQAIPYAVGAGILGYTMYRGGKNYLDTGNLFKGGTGTEYRPSRFAAWERAGSWEKRATNQATAARNAGIRSEWNSAIGNATAEKAFRDKYRIPKGKSSEKVSKMLTDDEQLGKLALPALPAIKGPTQRQVRWANIRNVGRGASYLGLGTGLGMAYYFGNKEQTPTTQQPVASPIVPIVEEVPDSTSQIQIQVPDSATSALRYQQLRDSLLNIGDDLQ